MSGIIAEERATLHNEQTVRLTLFIGFAIAARAQTPTDIAAMLNRVLPAVVTVAIEEESGMQRPFGIASTDAYDRVLDLTGTMSLGSGFVIERNGEKFVVTNVHVIQRSAGVIRAHSINQKTYVMQVAGADTMFDVALLRFTSPPGPELGTVTLRKDEAQLAEPVYTVGNPLGLYPYSVSSGIIGGRNRTVQGLSGAFGYLQTNAVIAAGNSGGPLIDVHGQVVGINTEIGLDPESGMALGNLNFALASPHIERVIHDLLANKGRLRRPYLGVEIGQEGTYMMVPVPVVVMGVLAGSPAAAAGLPTGAVVRSCNGRAIRQLEEVQQALEIADPTAPIVFELGLPGGDSTIVRIQPVDAAPARLEALARWVLERKAGMAPLAGPTLRLGEVKTAMTTRKPASLALPRARAVRQAAAPAPQKAPAGIGVVGAGVNIDKKGPVWRVDSLADLGVVMRISAMSGIIDLVVVEGNSEPALKRLWLGTKEDIPQRTLLY